MNGRKKKKIANRSPPPSFVNGVKRNRPTGVSDGRKKRKRKKEANPAAAFVHTTKSLDFYLPRTAAEILFRKKKYIKPSPRFLSC